MASVKGLVAVKNFIGQIIFHILLIYALLWFSGFMVAYFVGEISVIGLNNNAIYILAKWATWLKNVWLKLPFASYDYLKPKLIMAIFLPFLFALIVYIKNLKQLKKWNFFQNH